MTLSQDLAAASIEHPTTNPPISAVLISNLASTSSSAFFTKLPLEIRRQIYTHVFAGSVMLLNSPRGNSYCNICGKVGAGCSGYIRHHNTSCTKGNSYLQIRGPANYRVLLTCQALYLEARQLLASCLEIFMLYLETADTTEQVLCALKHDTFLRFVIPHIRCLNVRKDNQDTFKVFKAFPYLQVQQVLAALHITEPKFSAEGFMASDTDHRIIESVRTAIGQHVYSAGEGPYEIHLECCIVSDQINYPASDLEADKTRYVFTYSVCSGTISSKRIYQFDEKRKEFFESSGKKLLAPYGFYAEFEANMREDWDENYEAYLDELEASG